MDSKAFDELLLACGEIAESCPEGICFIGGIAVYIHAINKRETKELAEFTHDADLYISLADMADLRDMEEVTSNRRLSKHQLIKRGFEFDIYTERQSSLIVPYEAIIAHASSYGPLRVAALEHLLPLKLEAFIDRRGSAKGDKDAKDILRLACVAHAQPGGLKAEVAAAYMDERHMGLLADIQKGPYAMAMALGNAKKAKELRTIFADFVLKLASATNESDPKPSRQRG